MIKLNKINLEILNYCAFNNDPNYNFKKALEESIEFQEVIVKLQTKSKKNPKRPSENDAIDEFGDLIYRGLIHLRNILPEMEFEKINKRISERIDEKLSNLARYKEEGRYENGL